MTESCRAPALNLRGSTLANSPDCASTAVLLRHMQGRTVPAMTLITPLAGAVEVTVEECRANALHDVYIAAPSGPIESRVAIGALYLRDEFPVSRTAEH